MSMIMNEDPGTTNACGATVLELPPELVQQAFVHLGPRDLAACSWVSRQWRATARRLWKPLCLSKWKHWAPGTIEHLEERSEGWHRQFLRRRQLDRYAEELVDEIVWPGNEREIIERLIGLSPEVEDMLQRRSLARGPLEIGKKFWADKAHAQVRVAQCVKAMSELVQDPAAGEERIEEGALLLSKLVDHTADTEHVVRIIEALAAELRRRMEQDGAAPTSLRALELLSQLLFGDRAPEREQAWPAGAAEEWVPTGRYGLGLKGDEMQFYNPENSLITDILAGRGRGIPIALAVIHAAVGRRAGLPIECVGLPMKFVNKMGAPGTPEERFIDCFKGGRLLTRAGMQVMITELGMEYREQLLEPVGCVEVWVRMCANLAGVYHSAQRVPSAKLRAVLDMLLAANPHSATHLRLRIHTSLADRNCAQARQDLQVLLMGMGAGASQRVAHYAEYMHRIDEMEADWNEEHSQQYFRGTDVRYYVGDIMRHKRYNYRGVIFGWDPVCSASEDWIEQMHVDRLPGGRNQPFYQVLVDMRDRPFQVTYVAQENIKLRTRESIRQAAAVAAAAAGFVFAPSEDNTAAAVRDDVPAAAEDEPGTVADDDQMVDAEEQVEEQDEEAMAKDDDAAPTADDLAAAVLELGAAADEDPLVVEHPDVGRYFEGLPPGSSRYQPNRHLTWRYPDDADETQDVGLV